MVKRWLNYNLLRRSFPVLLLILLPLIVFYRATIGTHIFAMGDFSGSDLLELHLPFKYILHDAYTKGEFPLWTPYLSNGYPILAEGQSGPLYPPHIIFAFLPPYLALNYSLLLPLIIAGVGTYIFSRRIPGISQYGALTAALIFMFSSFFIARLKHLNMIAVAAYLPWSLWAITKSIGVIKQTAHINVIWFVVVGIVWGLQILAGHPHMFYFCALMTLWFIMGEALRVRIFYTSKNFTSIILTLICGVLIAGVVACGIGAAQLLPTFELTTLSTRLEYTYETATSFPLKPTFLASLFAPFFLGNPATGGYRGDIRVDGIWWENVLYIGLLPFALFIIIFGFQLRYFLSALRIRLFKKDFASWRIYWNQVHYYYWFFIASTIVFFLLSLGDYTGLFSVVYYNVPGMQLFRFPTRFNLFTLFSMAILTAFSVDRLIVRLEKSRIESDAKKEETSDYVFSWPFSTRITQAILFLLMLVDLVVFSYQYIGFFPIEKYLYTPATVKDLRAQTDSDFRIYPTTQYMQNPFKDLGWKRGEEAIYSLQQAIPGNFSAAYHLRSFTDRGWFEGGLGIAKRHMLEKLITENSLEESKLSRILGMWNVKYIIGFQTSDSDIFSEHRSYQLEKSFGLPLSVIENSYVLPRAYITQSIYKTSDDNALLNYLFSNFYNPEYYALSSLPIPKAKDSIATSSAAFDPALFRTHNSVHTLQSSALRVTMRVDSQDGGYLIFSDSYYPGWKAYIDGLNSPIYEVNLVQRAVQINKGSHTVTWIFEPWSFYIGLCITFSTIITCIALGIFALIKKGSAGRE